MYVSPLKWRECLFWVILPTLSKLCFMLGTSRHSRWISYIYLFLRKFSFPFASINALLPNLTCDLIYVYIIKNTSITSHKIVAIVVNKPLIFLYIVYQLTIIEKCSICFLIFRVISLMFCFERAMLFFMPKFLVISNNLAFLSTNNLSLNDTFFYKCHTLHNFYYLYFRTLFFWKIFICFLPLRFWLLGVHIELRLKNTL